MVRFVRDAVESVMKASDPVYAGLERERLPEDIGEINVDVDDTSTLSPSIHLHEAGEVRREDVIAGNLEELHLVIEKVAETHLKQFMPAFFDHVGVATEAVGNSVDLSNEEFTWDRLFDMYEHVEWTEDELGFVRPPQLVHSNPTELLSRLGEQTVDHKRRWATMHIQKQEEHVSRRRSRRLR